MNVEPDFGDTPIEDDPTGMRRLLAALPDPGPMPDDLAARILASIASEAAARSASASASAEPVVPAVPRSPDGVVTSLSHRSRSRGGSPASLRWLAAAAAVGVIGAGGFGLVRLLTGSLGGGAASGAALTTPGSGTVDDQQERQTDAANAPPGLGQHVRVLTTRSGVDYAPATLAEQVAPLVRAIDTAKGTNASHQVVTAAGARACAQALGMESATEIRVDDALFQGDPAAVLAVKGPTGWNAYAVPLTCGDGSPVRALAGPVPVR